MPLSPGQFEVAQSDIRFRTIVAGRRWGKTFLSIRELAKHSTLPNQRSFYVAPTYRQAKQIVWEPLKEKLRTVRWIQKVNESDLTVTLVNDSRISLRGADNRDSLRGVGLNFLVMDEFAMIDERAWTEVLRPTLSDTGGKAMFITTPLGIGNWAHDLFNMNEGNPDAWASWQFTSLSGGRIPAYEIEAARRDLDERTFRQEYEATFETYSGRIADQFDRKIHIKALPDNIKLDVIHVGLDFNVSPICATIAVKTDERTLHVFDEIKIYSSNTDELVTEIRNRYPQSKVFVYPDPSGNQRRTSANGMTDHKILANAGFLVKAPSKHDPVRDRINSLTSRLMSASKEVFLFFTPNCKHTIESLEKHTYKIGTGIPDKDSGYDHMFDALSYKVAFLYPIRRDVGNIIQPVRWNHATV